MNWFIKQGILIYLKSKRSKVNDIRQALAGKKTYLVGVLAILGTVISWSTGQMETGAAIEALVAAIMGMTIRAGVTKSGVNPTP